MNVIDIVPRNRWRPVLVVDAPTSDVGQLAALRDYVRQSLETGVLVLPDGCTWGLEAMPDDLGVRMMSPEYCAAVDELFQEPDQEPEPVPEPEPPPVREEPAPAAGPEGPPAKGPMDVSLHGGRNAGEKRDIQLRLIAYRRERGLGCWAAVARASRGNLSEDQLREMFLGNAILPVSEWRLAARALDRTEGRRNEGT